MMMTSAGKESSMVAKRKMVLTWTWHPRPLNTAVANSALVDGYQVRYGCDIALPGTGLPAGFTVYGCGKSQCDRQWRIT